MSGEKGASKGTWVVQVVMRDTFMVRADAEDEAKKAAMFKAAYEYGKGCEVVSVFDVTSALGDL